MNILSRTLSFAACLLSFTAVAQSNIPEIHLPSIGESIIIEQVSDNGKWGVSETGSKTDGTIAPAGGVLFNLDTFEQIDISHPSGRSGVSDVTDDGTIVSGECNGKPAYWRSGSGWTELPVPAGYALGRINAMTPDGHYGVGYVAPGDNIFVAYPVCYDLTNNTVLELPGLPVLDMTNQDQHQNCLYGISPDGRYLLGELSQSYLMPTALCCYIYDRQTSTYKIIGFNENFKGTWRPIINNCYFIDSPAMSPNGEWITGYAYMVEPVAGSEWPNEYHASFRYNIVEDKLEIYNKTGEGDMIGFSILNDGTVLTATPASHPYASAMMRYGDYFISLDQIFKQVYGIDIAAKTGFENTGKPIAVSGDGKTIVMLSGPHDSYVLKLKETINEAASRVDLLGSYTVNPSAGAVISQLRSYSITFERDIEINSPAAATFAGGGDSYTSLQTGGLSVDGKTLTVQFRTRKLKADTDYSLSLPAGLLRIKGDRNVTSPEITIPYKGRDDSPVKVVTAYPADDASVAVLDVSTNPIILTFDAELALVSGSVASLYREDEDTPFCTLNIECGGKMVAIYPLSHQNLFSGTDYRVVIPAGVVTDLSGGCANEEITLHYHGSYVREVSADDRFLFSSDCGNNDSFLFYEGDHKTPASVVAGWGFTTDNSPWYIVRSSVETTDMAMASHSMYNPAGQSDDWMVLPQLFIPDADCYLTFDAQSYLKKCNDHLKIYVYENSNVYNTLNAEIITDIRACGELVFDEQLSPGSSEEDLENDWQKYVVRLDKYAGKDIYIAFVNDNNDQSAVFVDNVQVIHDLRYLTTFENSSRVVNQSEIVIKGNITITTDIETYSSITLVLRDADNTEIDRISENDIELKKGDVYLFEFDTPLPLNPGVSNRLYVEIILGDHTAVVTGEVKNLAFEPYKRIVLEEYAGSECSNCPQGIVAIDNIKTLYPGQLIPITLRTYQGDRLGTGMSAYSQFLGMEQVGAPSARINRGDILFPMISVSGDYRFSGVGIVNELTGKDERLWLDCFREEISQPAESEINFTTSYDESTKKVNVECTVRSALNMTDANMNIFAVIIENGLETYQSNGFSSIDDSDFGDWGKNGKYGTSFVYPVMANDVARATFGTTFNGTGGMLPSTLESGKSYTAAFSIDLPSTVENPDNCEVAVMLINSVKGNVLNANIAPIRNGDTNLGVDNVIGDDGNIHIALVGGSVCINADSEISADVYTLTGARIATVKGNGLVEIPLGGYNGVVIVKAVAAGGAPVVKKLIVK